MTAVHGKVTNFYLGDFDATTYLDQAGGTKTIALANDDNFGIDDHQYKAGTEGGSVFAQGKGDFSASAVDEEFADALAGTVPWSVCPAGADAEADFGNQCIVLNCITNQYDFRSTPDDIVRIVAGGQPNVTRVGGIVLHPKVARTAAANFQSVDGAASSAFGAVANLHVFAFTGTTATVAIEDSANDSTWANLGTFTAVTAKTSQHLSMTGTVDRYTRVALSGTFTTITLAVTFARNRR